MGNTSESALRLAGTIRAVQKNSGELTYEHTPPILALRNKIKKAIESGGSVTDIKNKISQILDTSRVDFIDTKSADKLAEIGRKTNEKSVSFQDQ